MLDRFMIQLVMLALWICLGEAILLCLIILVRYWFGFNRAHVTDYYDGRHPDEQRYTMSPPQLRVNAYEYNSQPLFNYGNNHSYVDYQQARYWNAQPYAESFADTSYERNGSGVVVVLVLFCAVGFLIFLPIVVKLMFGM